MSRTAVVLPKGGGALRGIGETFRADPYSGTYQVSVPIDVPAGRGAAATPGLVLSYSSCGGNGPFGLGWSLAVPAVLRSTRKRIPHYDERDEFLLDGKDLTPVGDWTDTGGGSRERGYRMSGDRAYERVLRVRSGQHEWWELTNLSGTTTVLGPDHDSQLWDGAVGSARVFGWFAASATDTAGNRIEYRYKTDGAHNQLYLSRVDYLDAPGADNGWLYSVVLDYGDRDDAGRDVRSWSQRMEDAFSTFRSGFEIRTARRCRRILVLLNHPAPARAEVISRYDLAYETARGNAVSLLRSVTKTGVRPGDGTVEEQPQPPMEFGYTPWKSASGHVTEYSGPDVPRIFHEQGVELLDGQGYGCPGLVVYTGAERRYLDIDPTQTLKARGEQAGPDLPLGQSHVHLVDMTGDGYVDLASFKEPWGYYRAVPGSGWEPTPTKLGRAVPFVALLDNGRVVDVDGDGAADFIGISAGYFHVHHNGGEHGWSPRADKARIPAGCRPDFTDPHWRLADMSGDGPVDLVHVGDWSTTADTCRITVKYWSHHGHGVFSERPRELTLPLLTQDGASEDPFTSAWQPQRLLFTDVDGDGYDDVVYVRVADVVVWLNQAGNRLSSPVSIPLRAAGEPELDRLGPRNDALELASVRVADLGGRGTVGVLWSPTGTTARLRWAPLAPTIKPYLLTMVADHRGATATISYRSSAGYAYDDAARGRDRGWSTHLPFPVQLVDQVRVTDEFSQRSITTRYRYHEGVWDGVEREFRGFAHVDQYDTEAGRSTGTSRPVMTRFWFHVGVTGQAEHSVEPGLRDYWAKDPPLLTWSDNSTHLLDGLAASGRRQALRALSGKPRRTERFKAGDDPTWEPDPENDRPYSVTDYSYELSATCDTRRREDLDRQSNPVVAVLRRGERATQWERGQDPMTRIRYDLAHDEYGRPCRLVDAAAPRVRAADARPGTGSYLVVVTSRSYAAAADERRHMLDRVAVDIRYELTGEPAGPPDDLARRIEGYDWPTTPEDPARQVIGATATYYDGDEFVGKQLGVLEDFGLPTRVIRLVHTSDTLAAVFTDQPRPPWLTENRTAPDTPWPAEYPAAFQAAVTAQTTAGGGYIARPVSESALPDGLYVAEAARRYDTQPTNVRHRRGLVLASRDAAGVETVVTPDEHWICPATVTTAGVLEQHAAYDYRTQQPTTVTDTNGKHTHYTYTPLGLSHTIVRTAAMEGAEAAGQGDTPDRPGVVYAYGLTEYGDSPPEARRPVWVHARVRLLDAQAAARLRELFPDSDPNREPAAERRDYSDGLDRLLQSRIKRASPSVRDLGLTADPSQNPAALQVEPAADAVAWRLVGGWITRGPDGSTWTTPGSGLQVSDDPASPLVKVDGWVAYDDKGRVVERYEPFLDEGWAYSTSPPERRHGAVHKQLIHRDPRGIPETIINPDGTQRRFVRGHPASLTEPDRYDPSVWVAYEYDADDNARRTHPDADPPWHDHADTPASVEVDPLGRIVTVIERLVDDPEPAMGERKLRQLTTRIRRDIDGNVTEVIDALGRISYRARYDLLGRAWSEWTLDAGVVLSVYDPLGALVERRDARGARVLNAYDRLHRLSRRWARTGADGPMRLQHAVLYGDDAAAPKDSAAHNLRGRRWRSYDPAGVTVHQCYDMHDNPQETVRRWLPIDDLGIGTGEDHERSTPWPPQDLSRPETTDAALDTSHVRVTYVRDRTGGVHALSVSSSTLPAQTVRYHRDATGEVTAVYLRRAESRPEPVIQRILADALGNPILVQRPGVATRLLRDRRTSMLLRQHTERTDTAGSGEVLHNAALHHDPLGAVTRLDESRPTDRTLRTQTFSYDALHRVRAATGYAASAGATMPWDPPPDGAAEPCRYTYHYDDVGNLLRQRRTTHGRQERHTADLEPGTNRLANLIVEHDGADTTHIPYRTDAAGNMFSEGLDRVFGWDAAGGLHTIRSGSTTVAHWYSDDDHRRCSLLVAGDVAKSVTHHVDSWLTCISDRSGISAVTHTVTINGTPGGTPLAWITSRTDGVGALQLVTDYLDSVRAVLNPDGALRQTTDYTPYGLVSLRRTTDTVPRPLGYTAGEEDPVANLLLLGRRPYATWLGRFLSPESLHDHRVLGARAMAGVAEPTDPPNRRVPSWAQNPYAYAANSPLTVRDAGGRQAKTSNACTMPKLDPLDTKPFIPKDWDKPQPPQIRPDRSTPAEREAGQRRAEQGLKDLAAGKDPRAEEIRREAAKVNEFWKWFNDLGKGVTPPGTDIPGRVPGQIPQGPTPPRKEPPGESRPPPPRPPSA